MFETAPTIADDPAGHITDPLQSAEVLPPVPKVPEGHNVQFEPI